MTRRYYLAGVELTSVTVTGKPRSDALEGLSSSAYGGDIGTSGIVIDDPTGSVLIKGFMPFAVDDGDCTPARIWTGYIGSRNISEGDLVESKGVGRVWDCALMDLNFLLGLRILRNNASKRPAETDVARIQWLLGHASMTQAGPGVFDNGFVSTAGPRPYEESDYRKQYPAGVINSIIGDAKTFWVYWDPVAEQPSLFFGYHTTGFGDLTVKLSNDPADPDPGASPQTVFAALDGEEVARDPQGVASGINYVYKGVSIYRERTETSDEFGLKRDVLIENDRIGKLATAETHTEIALEQASVEMDVVSCVVHVKSSQVNWFREGWRVQAKFTHLPGYETYTWMTIQKRIVGLAPDAYDRYEIQLELTSKAPLGTSTGGAGGGDGDTGDFPTPPTTEVPQMHWWEGTFSLAGIAPNNAAQGNSGANVASLVTGETYTYSFTPTVLNNASASSNNMRLIDHSGFVTAVQEDFLSSEQGVEKTGSFLAGPTPNPVRVAASIDHKGNGTIPSGTISFWVDPSWWVIPEIPENPLPQPGQWVYDDVVTPAPDGVNKTFYTTHPFADGSLLLKVDRLDQTGAVVSSDGGAGTATLDSGMPTSDRGQRNVTLQTPAATVATPFGLTQINAARAAAGVNGIVRFPAATYAASPTMSVAGQKWQLAPGAVITGTVSITADDCTIQGGRVANIAVPRPSHAADRYTIADVIVYGTGNPILIEGAHNAGTITNCEFSGSSLDPIKMFIDTAPDGDVTGWDVLNNILSTNNDHSMISVNDGNDTNDIIGYRILNNDINAGARQTGDGFGIEVWGGVNGEIGYNLLRGGGFLISAVRSQNGHCHHNLGTLSAAGAYAFFESGGSDMTGWDIDYNVVNGDGTGAFIYHDDGAHDNEVAFNQVSHVQYFIQGSAPGGAYNVHDNPYTDVDTFIAPDASWDDPNPQARNGPGFGATGGTLTLAFAPKVGERVEATYQGR